MVTVVVRQLYILDETKAKHLVSWPQDLGEEHLFARPNIFCHFTQGIGDPKYCPVTDVAQLNKLLMDVLDSYNEVNAVMNLVGTLVMAGATRARDIDSPPGSRYSLSTQRPFEVPGGCPKLLCCQS